MSALTTALAALLVTVAPSDADADAAALVGSGGGVSVYDFEDDNVDGEVLSPNGANIQSRGRVQHASLLTLRPHFMVELHRLALDL